jgi:hypothetical protein
MILNNRELAILIWFSFLFCLFLFSKEMRSNFVGLLKAFLDWKIQLMVLSCAIYSGFIVSLLHRIDAWTFENSKTTILWFFTFAFAELMSLSKVKDEKAHFGNLIKSSFNLTVWLSVIVNYASFSLAKELIFVPVFGFILLLNGFALNQPDSSKVSSLLNFLILGTGLFLFSWNIYHIWISPEQFFSLANLRENGLPILLSIFYLPCLYFWYLFFAYEAHYSYLRFQLADPVLRRKTKWLLFKTFRNNREFLNRWRRHFNLFNPKDWSEIKETVDHIKSVREREKTPLLVHPENGWSPFLAAHFLEKEGLKPNDYHLQQDGVWFAGTNVFQFGKGIPLSSMDYFLTGNQTAIQKLDLYMNVNCPEDKIEAETKFRNNSKILLENILGTIDQKLFEKITYLDPFQISGKNVRITLKKDSWKGLIVDGYSLKLTIETTL